MGAAHVVEVGGELDVESLLAAALLGAAPGEGVVHADGGRLEGRRVRAVGEAQLQARLGEHPPADRPVLRQADHRVGGLGRVGAAEQVVAADAEVLRLARVDIHARAQRVVLRDRVVEPAADVEAVAGLLQPGVGVGGAVRRHGVQVRRRVLVAAAAVQRERRLVGLDRARQVEAVLLQLLGRLLRGERVARVHRFVPEADVRASPERPHAGHGHDVDEHHAAHAAVVLGGEHVHARQPDRSDLRLRRQAAAREAVHAQDRPGRRHRLEHRLHLVGIVRQRVDLLAGQNRAERAALCVERRRLPVAADGEPFLDALDLQRHAAPGVAPGRARARRARRRSRIPGTRPRSCSGRPGTSSITATPVPPVITGFEHSPRRAAHPGASRARRRSAPPGPSGRVTVTMTRPRRAAWAWAAAGAASPAASSAATTIRPGVRIYFATWNFFASIFGFTLMVSKTISSVGLPSIERWMRCGSCTPPTVL